MTQTLVRFDSLGFPEGPGWHNGRPWLSDAHAGRVITVTLDRQAETVVDVAGLPSRLGGLSDGRLLIVSVMDRRLLYLDRGGLSMSRAPERYGSALQAET